jgi:uncharacterized protein YcfJ
MEMNQASNRIHPLMAGAAASVMLVSMVGVAAITGILPNSHSISASAAPIDTRMAMAPATPAQPAPAQYAASAPAEAPVVIHKHIVEHKHVVKRTAPVDSQAPSPQYTQVSTASNQPYQQPQPTQQAAAPTSGVGIAAGAVIGGLLGNQVGDGRGRTLATVAGAVGGGYFGNEVEKRTRN